MQAIELVRHALTMTDGGFQAIVKDLREHPLAVQSEKGGNSVSWTLGHICVVEALIPTLLMGGESELKAWEPVFGLGTTPRPDGKGYPTFDELLTTYVRLRQKTLKLVEELGEEGMSRTPMNVSKGFENEMRTFGHTFVTIALHQMVHYGEMADVRRQVGLKPLV